MVPPTEAAAAVATVEAPSGCESPRIEGPHSLTRGMTVLGLGTAAVTGLTLLVTRMYADRYGAANLSAVLIFRLYGSVLVGVFGLGMPIALQRNVAFLAATPRRARTAALVGLGIGMGSFGAACLVSALLSSTIAGFLGNP